MRPGHRFVGMRRGDLLVQRAPETRLVGQLRESVVDLQGAAFEQILNPGGLLGSVFLNGRCRSGGVDVDAMRAC